MKENTIIFLDLDHVRLLAIIQYDYSFISHLTSALCIKRSLIEYKDPLSSDLEILEQFHGVGFKRIISDEYRGSNPLQITRPIYTLFEHILGSCTGSFLLRLHFFLESLYING